MSLRRILGGCIVGVVFGAIFLVGVFDVGLWPAVCIFGTAIAITALLVGGLWLVME